MDNYICINGVKIKLTQEQLNQLGIEPKQDNNPFNLRKDRSYYYFNNLGDVLEDHYARGCQTTKRRYEIGNYCTDKILMEQRVLKETLSRLLWRYSMEHGGDKIKWSEDSPIKWSLKFDQTTDSWDTIGSTSQDPVSVYFYNHKVAESAIKDVIDPFLRAHPEFKF